MYRAHLLLDELPKEQEPEAGALRLCFPGLQGCVLSRTIPERPIGWPEPRAAGVLDLWFRERSEAEQAMNADCSSCLPGARAELSLVGMERVVMRRPEFFSALSIKGVYLFRARAGMSLEAFRDYWWRQHGPLAALTRDATCYIQSHLLTTDDYHGITEIFWLSVAEAISAVASPQMVQDQAADATNFVEAGSVEPFLVQQQIIIQP